MQMNENILTVGELVPGFILPSQTGEPLATKDYIGKPIVLFFYTQDDSPTSNAIAGGFRDLFLQFQAIGVNIIGVSVNSVTSHAQFHEKYNLPFALLSDHQAKLSRAFGVLQAEIFADKTYLTARHTTFIINPNYRIAKVYTDVDPATHAVEVLADLKTMLFRETPRHTLMQAPVLLIPNVLQPEMCRRLMYIWETEGHGDSGSMRQVNGKTIGVFNYDHKIREDHYLAEGETKETLKALISRRVCSEIRKAFHFEVTRFEDFRIVCYDSKRGGYFRPHRDNTTEGTAHRRFAMTLNLNVEEYEGGYLRFPEYGPHLYRPETGSAVIFSCSLLHEATDVTAGRRFALLSFFYGEQEAKIRDAYHRKVREAEQAELTQVPEPA